MVKRAKESKKSAGGEKGAGGEKKEKEFVTFGWFSMVALTVNYTIGTGLLGIPIGVSQTSVFLSLMILIICLVSTALMAVYGNDAVARAFALERAHCTIGEMYARKREERKRKKHAKKLTAVSGTDRADPEPTSSTVLQNSTTGPEANEPLYDYGHMVPDYSIPNDQELVFSDMMAAFFGKAGFYIYQIFSILFQITSVWSYFNVVAQSLASVIPMPAFPAYKAAGSPGWVCNSPCGNANEYPLYCLQAYWFWLCITFIYAQIATFFDLAEQHVLQTIFTYCRFGIVILSILIPAITFGVSPYETIPARMNPPYQWGGNAIIYYNTYDTGSLISLIAFSLVFHNAIPEIIRPVKQSDRNKMNMAFILTYLILTIFTACIVFIDGVYFGMNSNGLVTLNFTSWDGVSWTNTTAEKPWWSYLISYVCRLLPPIYVITAIPINAIIERDCIVIFFPKRMQQNKWLAAAANIFSVVSGFFLAGYVKCLTVILNYSGLIAYFIMLMPGFMSYFGELQCVKVFGEQYRRTPYTSWMNHPAIIWVIIITMVISIPLTVISLAGSPPSP